MLCTVTLERSNTEAEQQKEKSIIYLFFIFERQINMCVFFQKRVKKGGWEGSEPVEMGAWKHAGCRLSTSQNNANRTKKRGGAKNRAPCC